MVSHLSRLYGQYRSLMDAALAVSHPLERAYLMRRANLILVRYLDEVDRVAEQLVVDGTGIFQPR